jgi:hypothetical protein
MFPFIDFLLRINSNNSDFNTLQLRPAGRVGLHRHDYIMLRPTSRARACAADVNVPIRIDIIGLALAASKYTEYICT